MEEAAAEMANTMNYRACKEMGVQEPFLSEWADGVSLEGAAGMEPFFFDDYPNLKENAEVAAKELERLTSRQKIFWFPREVIRPT